MKMPKVAAAAYHYMGDCDGCPDCPICWDECSKPNGCKRRPRAKKKKVAKKELKRRLREMINPVRMLERYEEKYGTWDEILDNYIAAKHSNRWMDKDKEEDKKAAKKYDSQMRHIDKLVWCVMGYHMGLKATSKEEAYRECRARKLWLYSDLKQD